MSYHGTIEKRLNVTTSDIQQIFIGDALFSYLVHYLENERVIVLLFKYDSRFGSILWLV